MVAIGFCKENLLRVVQIDWEYSVFGETAVGR